MQQQQHTGYLWIDSLNYLVVLAAFTIDDWLPRLQKISEIAALIVPILGAIWLLLQIGLKVYVHWKRLDLDQP